MINWRPSITIENLQKRHKFMQKIRNFFARHNIIEVTTPLLCHGTVTDPYIASIPVMLSEKTFYLQTSPEYAMKRLLAHGAPSIYQICSAFRNSEQGERHNIEFTMLEWYQTNINYKELMAFVDLFIQEILETPAAIKITYAELFQQHLQLDPMNVSKEHLLKKLANYSNIEAQNYDIPTLLNLLISLVIEPTLTGNQPWLVYDYPACFAMLATLKTTDPRYAERFEVYYQGIELGNAYNECTDANILLERFTRNNAERSRLGLPNIPIDQHFLAAMEHLPACSGIAIGLDRLFMCSINSKRLFDAISFPISDA